MKYASIRRVAAALILATGASSCLLAPKLVGIEPVTLDEGRREIEQCALDGTGLSAVTREVYALYDLERELAREPRAALRKLHAVACTEQDRTAFFALAETSYWLALQRPQRGLWLASAVYAYTYLFAAELGELPGPWERRFAWAGALYDQALVRAAAPRPGDAFVLEAGEHALPVGTLAVQHDRRALPATTLPLALLPADRFHIEGLKLRLRDSGLGVPLIATTPRGKSDADPVVAPLTAFLRLEGDARDLEHGLAATLEFHSGYSSESVVVNGQSVPLETDRSAVLAYVLDDPRHWRSSLTRFFRNENAEKTNRLVLTQPYEPGRVPIVFVHGTASSSAYWADLFNSLWREPELRRGAQFWFYQYSTGNPVLYSAADLRQELAETVARLDPAGTDAALRRMVVVGHSQGGLLARLLTVHGDLAWFEEVTGRTLASLALVPEDEAMLRRCLAFEPAPTVTRVVYISTPHGGSFQAGRWYSNWLANLISLPSDLTRLGTSVFRGRSDAALQRSLTSLGNMEPDSRLVQFLRRAEVAPNVQAHSLISIGDADPSDPAALATADDGVVTYASAHLEGVASEDLIPSNHSCQSHPATIRALRRTLLAHVRAEP
jgi:pimeloyl-ACP methyl ester carboxylesterase